GLSDIEPPIKSHDKPGGHDKKREQTRQITTKKALTKQSIMEDLMSPAAEKYVRCWLQNAQPTERAVVMDIFAKAAAAKKTENEKYSSFQCLLDEVKLKLPRALPHPKFSHGDGTPPLRYINLLAPEQRRDKWMYQTWHHLPPYRISEEAASRDYRGSMYTQPRRYQPSHYVIHPDMC
ncbi:hypothetical protein AHF37_04804, partial [Paragonimus kellicotti]